MFSNAPQAILAVGSGALLAHVNMKLKIKKIKCEVCDTVQEDKSAYPDFQQHTMLVVSVYDAEKQKRKYMDFCSLKCLREWANIPSSATPQAGLEPRTRNGSEQ